MVSTVSETVKDPVGTGQKVVGTAVGQAVAVAGAVTAKVAGRERAAARKAARSRPVAEPQAEPRKTAGDPKPPQEGPGEEGPAKKTAAKKTAAKKTAAKKTQPKKAAAKKAPAKKTAAKKTAAKKAQAKKTAAETSDAGRGLSDGPAHDPDPRRQHRPAPRPRHRRPGGHHGRSARSAGSPTGSCRGCAAPSRRATDDVHPLEADRRRRARGTADGPRPPARRLPAVARNIGPPRPDGQARPAGQAEERPRREAPATAPQHPSPSAIVGG